MDHKRNILLVALLLVSLLIFKQWQEDQTIPEQKAAPALIANSYTELPTAADEPQPAEEANRGELITAESDLLRLHIDPLGGDIVRAELLAYPKSLKDREPLPLLENKRNFIYQAQSGLVGPDGPDNSQAGRPQYQTKQKQYTLENGQENLQIPLSYLDTEGNLFQKIFTLRRGSYALDVVHQVDNGSQKPLSLSLFGQLKQSTNYPKEKRKGGAFATQTYRGTAYSSASSHYKKYSFKDIKNNDLNQSSNEGWVAMLQQYFASAWIPESGTQSQFYSKNIAQNQQAIIGFKGPPVRVAPGEQKLLKAQLWVGPELQDQMAVTARYLDLTVDYGWLWFISQPLFKLLKLIHGLVSNWGISIIVITFIVRGVLYPLTKAQYTSMAKMKHLQPKMEALRARCGDDRQRLSQEMMALYKKEKVNPLGGCLPVFVQMPIFLALYWMLMGSVELRHAPFAFWIRDLSAPDPFYVLPLLMGLTMLVIQKISPAATTDPIQQKVMNFMPIIFTFFFLWFPSGLVLYYLVSNLVTILLQRIITKQLGKRGYATPKS